MHSHVDLEQQFRYELPVCEPALRLRSYADRSSVSRLRTPT